jgi:propionate CoA-transferase
MTKILPATEAVSHVASGSTLAVAGFRWAGAPELLLGSLEERFKATKEPKGLTLVFSSAQGDGDGGGLERLAHPQLLSRVIGGFWGLSPRLVSLAQQNSIQAYNLPQGQICRLYQSIAAGSPGLVSQIGIDTFVDPRCGGGRLNEITTADLVEVITIKGQEYLLYAAFPIHVAFIRGTSADPDGNISFEEEAVTTEALSLAFAARNSGGRVFVQVKRMVPARSIPPRQVAVPGHLVDFVVVSENHERDHRQCVQSVYEPRFCSYVSPADPEPVSPDVVTLSRLLVANRAMCELAEGDTVNLGQGIPTDIVSALGSKGPAHVAFTIESGVVGGRPLAPPDFGISVSPQAILRQDDQFTFYNGGGLDIAFLGFAEVDGFGNVNVSRFSGRLVGCGGFIDIAQTSKRLVFCGTLTAGGLDVSIESGRLRIKKEGSTRKFLQKVEEQTFGSRHSIQSNRHVIYVTERCVFTLMAEGLRLDEVAPGIDVRTEILDQIGFSPKISPNLKSMALPTVRP